MLKHWRLTMLRRNLFLKYQPDFNTSPSNPPICTHEPDSSWEPRRFTEISANQLAHIDFSQAQTVLGIVCISNSEDFVQRTCLYTAVILKDPF